MHADELEPVGTQLAGEQRRALAEQHRRHRELDLVEVPDRRELRSVELHEVSIVQAHPAYDGTEVALRNRPRTVQMFILNPRKAWLETV